VSENRETCSSSRDHNESVQCLKDGASRSWQQCMWWCNETATHAVDL